MTDIQPPPLPCQHCGELLQRRRKPNGKLEARTEFARRRSCSNRCHLKSIHKARRGTGTSKSASHYEARDVAGTGSCQRCGSDRKVHIHHKDRDHLNNAPSNLERLCSVCHHREHRKDRKCTLCDRPHKARGYCDMHYQRAKASTPSTEPRT